MEEGKKKVYELDDVQEGYTNWEKIAKIYADLSEELNLEEPLQNASDSLITIRSPNWRGSSYCWELHSLDTQELIMLETYGGVDNYSQSNQFPKRIGDIGTGITGMVISVHNPKKETLSKIEKIISKYPKASKPSNL